MSDPLQRLAARRLPFATADAAACGIDRHTLARMVRAGVVHRACHGAFVPAQLWAAATSEERHLLVCRGVLARNRAVVLSHTAAAVAYGLPIVGVNLRVVHLTRTTHGRVGRTGRHPPLQVHPPLASPAYTATGDLPVCTAAVAALQVADWYGIEAGMVVAEAALHRGIITSAELRDAEHMVRLGRGRAHATKVVRLADSLSESPGETLTRPLLHTLGITDAQQQVRIRLPSGRVARVDFLLPDHGIVIEFDGAVKYEGARGRDELISEKRREDDIRSIGYRVVRVIWPGLRRRQSACGVSWSRQAGQRPCR